MTAYGFSEPAAALLGEVVQERAKVAELLQQGHYSDAAGVADEALRRLSERLPSSDVADLDTGYLPLVLQGVALLADSSFSTLAAGDSAGAAERLRVLGQFGGQLTGLADRVAGLAMQTCEHGRPSLDGGCLKTPPCP